MCNIILPEHKIEIPESKLEQIRANMRKKIVITKETTEEMAQTIKRQEALVNSMLNMYTMYDNGIPFRPTLGNEMQVMYMRERQTLSFLLFPELLKLEYEIARVIGDVFIAPMLEGKTLPEELDILHQSSTGRLSTIIVRGEPGAVLSRLQECEPLFVDALPLSLEEIFIYELGGADYAVKEIVL